MRFRTVLIGVIFLMMGAATATFASDFSLGVGFWSDNNAVVSGDYPVDYSRSGLRLVAEGQVGALGGQVEVLTGKVNSFFCGGPYDIDFSKALGVSVIGTYRIPLSSTIEIAPLLGYSTDRMVYGEYRDVVPTQLGDQDGYEEEWVNSGIMLGAQATARVTATIQASLDLRYTPNASKTVSVYSKRNPNWYKLKLDSIRGTKTQWRLGISALLTPAWNLEGSYAGSSLFIKEQQSRASQTWSDGTSSESTFTMSSETTTSNTLFLGAAYRF